MGRLPLKPHPPRLVPSLLTDGLMGIRIGTPKPLGHTAPITAADRRELDAMQTAEAIMTVAREHGLEHFFGIPGSGAPLDLIEAGRRPGVKFVNVSHESSAAIAASYYGGIKRTAGLAMSIRGVGAANLAGGVANVYFERQPLVAVCESAAPGRQAVQQCEQQRIFDAISGYQATLTSDMGMRMIRDAFTHAIDGRPSPSVLHWPRGMNDVRSVTQSIADSKTEPPLMKEPDLDRVVDFIARTRRAVLLAGADVIRDGAAEALRAFAEAIEAAVLVTMDARGVFPESHPRWAGVFLGVFNPNVIESRVFEHADGVILVGVDSMMTHSSWKLRLPTCEIVTEAHYPTMTSPKECIAGDLKLLLRRLSTRSKPGFSCDEIRAMRDGVATHFKRPPNARFAAQDIIEISRELLPRDGLLISETGAFICLLEHLWTVDSPGTYLGTSGGRTMGLMLPAILGARLANSKLPMMGMGGDGSLLMRLGELESLARAGINVPLVIINDRALGTMKFHQRWRGYQDFGLDFNCVNFAAVARACGLNGVVAKTPEAFRRGLQRALKSKRGTLIDAQIDPRPYQDGFGPTIGVLEQPASTSPLLTDQRPNAMCERAAVSRGEQHLRSAPDE